MRVQTGRNEKKRHALLEKGTKILEMLETRGIRLVSEGSVYIMRTNEQFTIRLDIKLQICLRLRNRRSKSSLNHPDPHLVCAFHGNIARISYPEQPLFMHSVIHQIIS